MKEHFQDYGIRKWAGNDLIELQSEPLEALQKLVEPYAPCILQGCGVTKNEGDTITIAPGLVALQGKDYKGEDCVKIARFAGVANEKPPVYLILECEPDKRVYGDSKSKAIAYHYRAVATTQKPEKPYLEINAGGAKRLVDTLGITQKLDREGGNASDVKVVSFTTDTAQDRTNIAPGMTLKELFGRISRWLSELKAMAFKAQVAKSDFDKTLTEAFDNKVDKDPKRGLSEYDFSKKYKDKLDGIAEGAKVNVLANWDETDTTSDAFIQNKPTSLPANGGTAETISGVLPVANGGTGASTADTAVTNLLRGAQDGTANPTDAAHIIISGNGTTTYYKKPLSLLWNWIKGKLKTVATSGSYNDLTDKPNAATQSAAGFMSAADKKKLDEISFENNLIVDDISNNQTIYPGNTLFVNINNLTVCVGVATNQYCRSGARAYLYQDGGSGFKIDLVNISLSILSTTANKQLNLFSTKEKLILEKASGLWTITWFADRMIFIDFTPSKE